MGLIILVTGLILMGMFARHQQRMAEIADRPSLRHIEQELRQLRMDLAVLKASMDSHAATLDRAVRALRVPTEETFHGS